MAAAVYVRAEFHAVVAYFVELREREYLKAAAVGQYRALPVHEAVQAARFLDQIFARAHVQVVGVAEYYLRAEAFELVGRHSLDGRLRADGHEYRRFDNAVRRDELPGPRAGLGAPGYKSILEHCAPPV